MEEKQRSSEAHILVIPFPLTGHVNPMLQFSRRLASEGLRITFCTKSTTLNKSTDSQSESSITFFPISDGLGNNNLGSLDESLDFYRITVSKSIANLIEESNIKFIVYDSFMPWVLDFAHEHGIDGAPFFTQACSVNVIYYHLHQRSLKIEEIQSREVLELPSMPVLKISEIPSFVYDMRSYPILRNVVVNQFSNLQDAKWVFCNTFDKLELEIVQWMASRRPIKTIGPTIPSMYMDKRLEDDKDYGLNFFKPNEDTYIKWLDSKPINSVVYVSFGSLASLGEEQMEEIAFGLNKSDCFFLWVVRESEIAKMPKSFLEDTSEKGLVLSWCNQLQVLNHKAIGCFMTHNGWNSTIEALSLGVPMIAVPQWTDQTMNAKFVEEVWKTGVRVRKDERKIARKEEIEICIRELLEGEKGNEIRVNALEWKRAAVEAVDEGGSSDKNIEEFVKEMNG